MTLQELLQEFINKYKGVGVDYDGAYGFQCMDLAHFYKKDVLGIKETSVLAAPTAAAAYKGFKPEWGKYFTKIDNTLLGVPEPGDIIYFDGAVGHVAIFVSGNAWSFTSFDQNYPTGSLPHLQTHNYLNPKVLGWLRPRVQSIDYKKMYEESVKENQKLVGKINAAKAALE